MATTLTGVTEEQLEALYLHEFNGLVRLGVLLVGDVGLAEELVQDAFLGLYARMGRVRGPSSALSYLRMSVVNGARSSFRRLRTARSHRRELLGSDVPGPESAVLLADRDRQVARALSTLPRRQREVVVLRFWSDLSYAQLAAELGISVGTATSLASKATKHLRQRLESDDDR